MNEWAFDIVLCLLLLECEFEYNEVSLYLEV